MDKFITKWNDRSVQDGGAYMSEEANTFVKEFKAYMKRALPGAEIAGYNFGHYDLSGFVKKDDACVYFSYSIPRGERAMKLAPEGPWDRGNFMEQLLYRTAKDEHDFRGGPNNYCHVSQAGECIEHLLEREIAKSTLAKADAAHEEDGMEMDL